MGHIGGEADPSGAPCAMRNWAAFPRDKQRLRPHLGPLSSLRLSIFLGKDM